MTASEIISMLVVDQVGSTQLLERLGDEAAESARRRFFVLLRDALASTSGQEVKNTGDGLIAVFPSALDAVGCAVTMQQAVERHARKAEERGFVVRIGVHVGEPFREEGDFFGRLAIVATRLCEAAQPRQILVSEVVRMLIGSRGSYSFTGLGRRALKGLDEELHLYEVAWEQVAGLDVPLPASLAVRSTSPFFGRDRELERMLGIWKATGAGERQVVFIAGEPGIGKTRLAAQLAQQVHDDGAIVLFGRCDDETAIPYQPFVEALSHYIAALSDYEVRVRTGGFAPELALLLPELSRRLSGIADRLRAHPETERLRLFDAVTWLIAREPQREPLLLVLDDLHWADKPSLLLLKHLIQSSHRAPILILGTYRDTETHQSGALTDLFADLRRETTFERVALQGLPASDVAEMVERVSRHDDRALARRVHEKTDGNPFFVLEILRDLVESGAGGDELGIPEGVKEVIGQRLARLSAQCQKTLATASVIGTQFEFEVLEQVSDLSTESLIDALEEAVSAGLVLDDSDGSARYSFSHALTRDTLYDEVTTARRVQLHRRAGEALEKLYGPEGDRLAEIAYHLCASARPADTGLAVEYAARAGRQALDALAYEDAVGQYERALRTLELDRYPDPQRRCELLLALSDAQMKAGEIPRSQESARVVAALARDLGDPEMLARGGLAFGAYPLLQGRADYDPDLVDLLEEAVDALPEADTPLKARLLGRLAMELGYAGVPERQSSVAHQAVGMARRLEDPDSLGWALVGKQFSLWGPRNLNERLLNSAEVLRIARDNDDAELELVGYLMRVQGSLSQGNRGSVEAAIEAFGKQAQDLRLKYYQWWPAMWEAMLALLDGRYSEAERLIQQAFALGQELGRPDAMLHFGVQLQWLRLNEARGAEIYAAVTADAAAYSHPAARANLAFVLVDEQIGRHDEARDLLADLAKDDFAVLPRDFNWLVGLSSLSYVAYMLGEKERAARLYELLLPNADEIIFLGWPTIVVGSARLLLALLATTLADWEAADEHFRAALAANLRLGSRPLAAEVRFEHGQMLLARRAPGDEARAHGLIQDAVRTARELGMQRLLNRAAALGYPS